MPLNANEERRRRILDRLEHTVGGLRRDAPPPRRLRHTLVVVRDDPRAPNPKDRAEARAGLDLHVVGGAVVEHAFDPRVGEVLVERGAVGECQHLHPQANPERRDRPREDSAREREVELLSPRMHQFHARMQLDPRAARVDVAAAGQDDPIDPLEEARRVVGVARRQHHGDPAGAPHRVDIVELDPDRGLGIALEVAVDTNDRLHRRQDGLAPSPVEAPAPRFCGNHSQLFSEREVEPEDRVAIPRHLHRAEGVVEVLPPRLAHRAAMPRQLGPRLDAVAIDPLDHLLVGESPPFRHPQVDQRERPLEAHFVAHPPADRELQILGRADLPSTGPQKVSSLGAWRTIKYWGPSPRFEKTKTLIRWVSACMARSLRQN